MRGVEKIGQICQNTVFSLLGDGDLAFGHKHQSFNTIDPAQHLLLFWEKNKTLHITQKILCSHWKLEIKRAYQNASWPTTIWNFRLFGDVVYRYGLIWLRTRCLWRPINSRGGSFGKETKIIWNRKELHRFGWFFQPMVWPMNVVRALRNEAKHQPWFDFERKKFHARLNVAMPNLCCVSLRSADCDFAKLCNQPLEK